MVVVDGSANEASESLCWLMDNVEVGCFELLTFLMILFATSSFIVA